MSECIRFRAVGGVHEAKVGAIRLCDDGESVLSEWNGAFVKVKYEGSEYTKRTARLAAALAVVAAVRSLRGEP